MKEKLGKGTGIKKANFIRGTIAGGLAFTSVSLFACGGSEPTSTPGLEPSSTPTQPSFELSEKKSFLMQNNWQTYLQVNPGQILMIQGGKMSSEGKTLYQEDAISLILDVNNSQEAAEIRIVSNQDSNMITTQSLKPNDHFTWTMALNNKILELSEDIASKGKPVSYAVFGEDGSIIEAGITSKQINEGLDSITLLEAIVERDIPTSTERDMNFQVGAEEIVVVVGNQFGFLARNPLFGTRDNLFRQEDNTKQVAVLVNTGTDPKVLQFTHTQAATNTSFRFILKNSVTQKGWEKALQSFIDSAKSRQQDVNFAVVDLDSETIIRQGSFSQTAEKQSQEQPALEATATKSPTPTKTPVLLTPTPTRTPTKTPTSEPTPTAPGPTPTATPKPTVVEQQTISAPNYGVSYDSNKQRCQVIDRNTRQVVDPAVVESIRRIKDVQTGVGNTENIEVTLRPGQAAIIEGYRVDGKIDGVFKVVIASGDSHVTFTSRIADGRIQVVNAQDAPFVFCQALRAAVANNWAHSHVEVPQEWVVKSS